MTSSLNPVVHQALTMASQCLQRRDVAGAERALMPVMALSNTVPAVQHALGSVRLFQGQFAPAAELFAKARAAVPRDPVLAYQEGQALAGLERFSDALTSFRAALALKPDFPEARFEVGRLLHRTGALEQAEQVFREILRQIPGQEPATIALAAVLIEQGKAGDAEILLRQALERQPARETAVQLHLQLSFALRRQRKDEEALAVCSSARLSDAPQILLQRANCLQNLERHEEALDIYRNLMAREPANPVWHHSYNELLHRLGRKDEFLRSYDAAPASRPLRLGKAFFLRQENRHAECLEAYETLLKQDGSDRAAAIGAARALASMGRHDQARARFAQLTAMGADAGLLNLAAEAALLAGDPGQAAQLCERALMQSPLDGSCLAYLSTAWRLLGDAREEALCGYDTLVRMFDLEPPQGYSNMADFNGELSAAVTALHPNTGGFMGQSLRGGSQTPEQLFDTPNPLIGKLKRRITEAVDRYIAELGEDTGHPFLSRRTKGFRYSGSWSSRLRDRGFHVNHIHPQGWISSCYYVAVPPAAKNGRQGWLKFGEPALDIPLYRPIRRAIQPVPGRLVLFPSYLWHGTIAFRDDAPRLTVAFDVVPVS
jgi:tetratricopeptide (TPR) repeat protein